MEAKITALWRHPVKGFTPEPVANATLEAGQGFPFDRLFAVEYGPSGFDPLAPAFISKTRFTVLAHMPQVARARTSYDQNTRMFRVSAEGQPDLGADLTSETGRLALEQWLTHLLDGDPSRPLKLLHHAPGHRFMDHPQGHVSILNLASVRDLEARLGRPIDPLRFRANIWVEGWPAWAEHDWKGRSLTLGDGKATVYAPIVRCAAVEVDPQTAERDLPVVQALFDAYGHMDMGLYLHVTHTAQLQPGLTVALNP
jgi:uncharacterized protein YcbX